MTIQTPFSVRLASWDGDRPGLGLVRRRVFIEEQQIPASMEWDEMDPCSLHLLAVDGEGRPIGTGRLLPDGHIGRLAVLPHWRGRGVGAALLERLIQHAREQGLPEIVLNSQRQAIDFYRRRGFTAEGTEFMEAGIPHQRMRLKL